MDKLASILLFVRVAETGSFSAVASEMGTTQSSVSKKIAALESSLGFKLFVRSTRKVSLSAEGKEFYASAQTVLKHLHLAEVAATDLRNRASGLVRIAAPMVIASTILPPLIRDYTLDRPKIVVRIRDAIETAAGVLGNIGLASRVIGFLSILAGATRRCRLHQRGVSGRRLTWPPANSAHGS